MLTNTRALAIARAVAAALTGAATSSAGCASDDNSTADSIEIEAGTMGDAAVDRAAASDPLDAGAPQPMADSGAGSDSSGSHDAALGMGMDMDGRSLDPDAGATRDEALSDTQPVRLRFRAQLADKPFACGQRYAAQGTTKRAITPRDLRLFVQDVSLLNDAGEEIPVELDERAPWQTSEVALLDFEDASGECAGDSGENHEITGRVPAGTYTGVRFTNGVPHALNHSDPETYPAPLLTPGMSWSWLLGLRFIKFETLSLDSPESVAEADADGGVFPGNFALHVGSVGCAGNAKAGTIQCAKPNRNRVHLDSFDPGEDEIVLDLSPLVEAFDLSSTVECHSASAPCEPMFRALGIDYATGEAAETTAAYRASASR